MNSKLQTLKLAAINIITLLIGVALLSGSMSQKSAHAARFEVIPQIKMDSLKSYKGKYLTVLYAVASRPILGKNKGQITISQIKDSRTVFVTEDSMTLPSVQVEKEGFRPSYNMIIAVVSDEADFSWINPDGTLPEGMLTSNNTQKNLIKWLNKDEVDAFVASHSMDQKNVSMLFDIKKQMSN